MKMQRMWRGHVVTRTESELGHPPQPGPVDFLHLYLNFLAKHVGSNAFRFLAALPGR